jgi:arsenate reductase
MKQSVLFLCERNAGRSQIAEGLLNHFYGDRYEAFSAGMRPSVINTAVIQVMEEIGVDMTGHTSKALSGFSAGYFDFVVLMTDYGSGMALPPHRNCIRQHFPDPAVHTDPCDGQLMRFRKLRDDIHKWISGRFGLVSADEKL